MPPESEIDDTRRVWFDAKAELYDAARPSYPDALADDVLSRAGRRVLEIGAGTGKATVVFARRGASIVAIEPGANLAAVLRRNVAGYDVTIENTTFEDWPITRVFDVVTAAQAIHWVDPRVRYVKAAAVLAPGGTLAVIRNEKAPFERGLQDELDAAYARWHPHSGHRPVEDAVETAQQMLAGEIDASGLFGPVEVKLYPSPTTYTTARYLELLETHSDHTVLAPEHRTPLYQAIAEVIERRGGVIEVPYVAMAIMARRA